ncbi:hypothetical protein DESUT3_28720 [Desulfuromonas versatilis]|uniref:Pectate lyase n=2 Tax=Desulfuromonas versatilis TaxID=2802975 RepID=A0ABN6E0B0_9BACT|nr:hypothetical protein DESUT3_28720 [Desulfuromonas versatilis]
MSPSEEYFKVSGTFLNNNKSDNLNMGSAVSVFPGAEGFGANSLAGRGGKLIKVTNLNDNGPGSLRNAINSPGARIVVFEVGGSIVLESDLEIKNPYMSIYGQTAPFPGIQIGGGRLTVETHDILIQHIRVRNGKKDGESHSLRVISGAYNVIVDHCTFMWASDEIVAVWTNRDSIYNITISNNIIAESLGGGTGIAIGSGSHNNSYFLGENKVSRVSIVKNLISGASERVPMVSRESSVVILNNLGFDSVWGFVELGVNDGPVRVSVVGNHFIKGKRNKKIPSIWVKKITKGKHSVYVSSNIFEGDDLVGEDVVDYGGDSIVYSPPEMDNTLILNVENVFDYVVKNSGARPSQRDAIEMRIIKNLENPGKDWWRIKDGDIEWPEVYRKPTFRRFHIPKDPDTDSNNNGYTNIEEYIYCKYQDVYNDPISYEFCFE